MPSILITLIIAWIAVFLIAEKYRAKLEALGIEKFFFGFILRTERGIPSIQRTAQKFSRALKLLATLSVIVSPLFIVFVFLNLGLGAAHILKTPNAEAGMAPVIPGVEIPGSPVFLPLWQGVFALIIVIIAHELMHGLLSAAEGVKIKSVGLLTATLFPIGAFIEPDEEELAKKPLLSRLRVYAAGSFGNFAAALIVFIFFIFVFKPIAFDEAGVRVISVSENSPAQRAGIAAGDKILMIKGEKVASIEQFVAAARALKPGEEVLIETSRGTRSVALGEKEGRGYVGIAVEPAIAVSPPVEKMFGEGKVFWAGEALWWTILLNFFIGLTNLLPMVPFDGGRMLQDVLDKHSPSLSKGVTAAVFLLVLSLIFINMSPIIRHII